MPFWNKAFTLTAEILVTVIIAILITITHPGFVNAPVVVAFYMLFRTFCACAKRKRKEDYSNLLSLFFHGMPEVFAKTIDLTVVKIFLSGLERGRHLQGLIFAVEVLILLNWSGLCSL